MYIDSAHLSPLRQSIMILKDQFMKDKTEHIGLFAPQGAAATAKGAVARKNVFGGTAEEERAYLQEAVKAVKGHSVGTFAPGGAVATAPGADARANTFRPAALSYLGREGILALSGSGAGAGAGAGVGVREEGGSPTGKKPLG